MHVIRQHFDSREALRQALLDEFVDAGLFVPGTSTLTLGEPVLCELSVDGLAAGVTVEGIVQWRRLGRAGGDKSAGPGIAIRMLASEREQMAFVRDWADGRREASGRREQRFRVVRPVRLRHTEAAEERTTHATLRDVSVSGGRVTAPGGLAVGSTCKVDVTLGAHSSRTLSASVVWATPGRAGMRFVFATTAERAAWIAALGALVPSLAASSTPDPPPAEPRAARPQTGPRQRPAVAPRPTPALGTPAATPTSERPRSGEVLRHDIAAGAQPPPPPAAPARVAQAAGARFVHRPTAAFGAAPPENLPPAADLAARVDDPRRRR